MTKPSFTLPEENRTGARSVNLNVAVSAVGVLRVLVVLWAGGLLGSNAMRRAVARKAELSHPAGYEQARIG